MNHMMTLDVITNQILKDIIHHEISFKNFLHLLLWPPFKIAMHMSFCS